MSEPKNRQQDLERLLAQPQEPGVTQAVATYEAVEQAYFRALAATPRPVQATSYATTTSGR